MLEPRHQGAQVQGGHYQGSHQAQQPEQTRDRETDSREQGQTLGSAVQLRASGLQLQLLLQTDKGGGVRGRGTREPVLLLDR